MTAGLREAAGKGDLQAGGGTGCREVTAKWEEVQMGGPGALGAACCTVRVCGKNGEALVLGPGMRRGCSYSASLECTKALSSIPSIAEPQLWWRSPLVPALRK